MNPDLVARDEDGKIMSVRYEAVNAMLLNEFLKEHGKAFREEQRKAQELEAIAAASKSKSKRSLLTSKSERTARRQRADRCREWSRTISNVFGYGYS